MSWICGAIGHTYTETTLKINVVYCKRCGKVDCIHEWDIIHHNVAYNDERDAYPIYKKYVLQCKNCGDVKNHSTRD